VFGHAVGDALGVPVEFCQRSYLYRFPVTTMTGFGSHDVPAGCWSDDTSMALCALESLSHGFVDYDDIMNNFCKWYNDGQFTATDLVFDIGNACRKAIMNYHINNLSIENCGLKSVWDNGNGSLMRIYPFVLYAYCNGIPDNEFVNMIKRGSALTHAHKYSIDGCLIYSYILKEILNNPTKESVYKGIKQAKQLIGESVPYHALFNINFAVLHRGNIKSSGYVVDTLEAAIWCLLTTNNYHDCVLKAVNLGEDTDTVAAVTGSLAGAMYGIHSIPNSWMETIKKKQYLENICENAHKAWRYNAV
jgi:ADP-ribosylglycohydrolase